MSLPLARNFQTHGEGSARFGFAVRLFFGKIAVRIAPVVLSAFCCLSACTLDYALLDSSVRAFFFRREITIGFALFKKPLRGSSMLRRVVGLKDNLFVVIEAEPVKTLND